MFQLRDNNYFVYIASPVVHCWSDLENRKMKLSDVPMWDVTRDFLVADLQYRYHLVATKNCVCNVLIVKGVQEVTYVARQVLWLHADYYE